jgi:hypothetical protein
MGVIHDQKGALLHRRLVLGLGAFSAVAVLDGLQNAARAESGGIKLTVLYAKPKDPTLLTNTTSTNTCLWWRRFLGFSERRWRPSYRPRRINQSRHIGGSQSFTSRASTISKRGSHPRRVKRPLRI